MNKLQTRQKIVKDLLHFYKIDEEATDIVLREMTALFEDGQLLEMKRQEKIRDLQRLYDALPNTFEEERN